MEIKKGQIITIADIVTGYSALYNDYKVSKSRKLKKILIKIAKTKVTING